MAGRQHLAPWLAVALRVDRVGEAEVVRIEVATRSDVAGGAAYGTAGPYEKLRGTLHFAVDPSVAANRTSPTSRWRRRTRPAASSSQPISSC